MPARSTVAVVAVYVAGLLQGLTLVSFPALSGLLEQLDGLTDAQYGLIFLPQVAAAVVGAALGGALAGRFGLRAIFLVAVAANGASQGMLAASAVAGPAAFGVILVGTACLGFGFGLGGAPYNSYPGLLFPAKGGTALLVFHSTMGAGLSLGPLLVGALLGGGAWIAFPIGLGILCLGLVVTIARTPFPDAARQSSSDLREARPVGVPEFWVLTSIAVVYAFSEGTFSNWAVIYVHDARGLPAETATAALSGFWAALVVGRLLVSGLLLRVSPVVPWALLPVISAAAFLLVPEITTPGGAIAIFALGGLGCSAFFPLTVAVASARFPRAVALTSSVLTAALMLGSGVATFAIGGLHQFLTLENLYLASTIYPLLSLVLIAVILWRRSVRRIVPA